eukprot:747479-Hanusia_phi.AAC.1
MLDRGGEVGVGDCRTLLLLDSAVILGVGVCPLKHRVVSGKYGVVKVFRRVGGGFCVKVRGTGVFSAMGTRMHEVG